MQAQVTDKMFKKEPRWWHEQSEASGKFPQRLSPVSRPGQPRPAGQVDSAHCFSASRSRWKFPPWPRWHPWWSQCDDYITPFSMRDNINFPDASRAHSENCFFLELESSQYPHLHFLESGCHDLVTGSTIHNIITVAGIFQAMTGLVTQLSSSFCVKLNFECYILC